MLNLSNFDRAAHMLMIAIMPVAFLAAALVQVAGA